MNFSSNLEPYQGFNKFTKMDKKLAGKTEAISMMIKTSIKEDP
jgi:hypothetical protein